MFNLCEETGAMAIDGECPLHRIDGCLAMYTKVENEEEYWKSVEARRTYREVNEISLRQLRKAKDELVKAIAWISQPRESIMGTLPPRVPEEDQDNE